MPETGFVDEQVKAIQVAWFSSMPFPALEYLSFDFEFQQVADSNLHDSVFDLAVLDVHAFANLEELRRRYSTLGIPAVLIIDTAEQETAVLNWLEAGHETCRRDAVEQQLALRMRRSVFNDSMRNHSTTVDSLTGIANRSALHEYVTRILTSNAATDPLCLIFLDIDRFKSVNDRVGHSAGDQLLVQVARLLQQYALGGGIVARVGGDEFAIAMRGNLQQGRAFAEFLRAQISAHEFKPGQAVGIQITSSFGVVSANGNSSSEKLVEQADQSLYAAKSEGGNRVVTSEDVDALVDAAGQDTLIADFENRIRVSAERMSNELVLKARRLSMQYRSEADHDGLTGIFNRRHLDRLLSRQVEVCRKQDKRLTIALLDLDHFGEINKTYGFPTGDRALKTVAIVLQDNVRALDWVARYGGEEFCVVMPDTDLNAGAQIAERIRQALGLKQVVSYDERQFEITASFGVVELLGEDTDHVALFQRASDKVREAKADGRNRTRS